MGFSMSLVEKAARCATSPTIDSKLAASLNGAQEVFESLGIKSATKGFVAGAEGEIGSVVAGVQRRLNDAKAATVSTSDVSIFGNVQPRRWAPTRDSSHLSFLRVQTNSARIHEYNFSEMTAADLNRPGLKGVIDRNRDAVVKVSVGTDLGTGTGTATSTGTGFFVGKEGLGATNWHVVEKAGGLLKITEQKGQVYSAKVIARDKVSDLALFQVINKPHTNPFKTVELAEDPSFRSMSVLGHPKGGNLTFSEAKYGRIQALNRAGGQLSIPLSEHFHGASMWNVITSPCALPGSSGSPMFDFGGRCGGIVRQVTKLPQVLTADGSVFRNEFLNTEATHVSHLKALIESIANRRNVFVDAIPAVTKNGSKLTARILKSYELPL